MNISLTHFVKHLKYPSPNNHMPYALVQFFPNSTKTSQSSSPNTIHQLDPDPLCKFSSSSPNTIHQLDPDPLCKFSSSSPNTIHQLDPDPLCKFSLLETMSSPNLHVPTKPEAQFCNLN
eukprot:TRINITY_DN6851_c0_g1_i2.p2 TRINITY_DN6851_c0_g1~~TRINITY_DN6851_c0_g1_i2.p2  ORF type:complete len:119 (-),score=8.95 TRINITY_DN6851_c0_g1_i2:2466-2822(-)